MLSLAAIALVVVAIGLVAALVRPRARRLGPGSAAALAPRTDRLLGQRAKVTEAIDPIHGTGRVLVAGEDWAAQAPDPVPAGAIVVVHGADGIVLHVTPEE